jgi:tetraacyldisaccharide 4'-kinase
MKFKKPKFWDYKTLNMFAYLLLPFSKILQLIIIFKFKKKIKFNGIKTICLGNFYLGGTGKTSLAIKIKEILERDKLKVCFIKKFYYWQKDEQILLSKRGKTFVEKNRINAIKKAILENYDVAIFDDGAQDHSIDYDLIFICFNNLNWIGNGLTLPAGPLREKIDNLKYYDNVFLNGNDENLYNIKDKIKKINEKINIHVSKYVPLNINEFKKNEKFLVFSGIGNHRTFVNMLKDHNIDIIKDIEFPDHFNYSDNDLDEILNWSKKLNAKIITTEKDYLRIDKSKLKTVKYIKSEINILDENKFINTLKCLK